MRPILPYSLLVIVDAVADRFSPLHANVRHRQPPSVQRRKAATKCAPATLPAPDFTAPPRSADSLLFEALRACLVGRNCRGDDRDGPY
jgi:hypothetical protein